MYVLCIYVSCVCVCVYYDTILTQVENKEFNNKHRNYLWRIIYNDQVWEMCKSWSYVYNKL